jgi:hypothetical protein
MIKWLTHVMLLFLMFWIKRKRCRYLRRRRFLRLRSPSGIAPKLLAAARDLLLTSGRVLGRHIVKRASDPTTTFRARAPPHSGA